MCIFFYSCRIMGVFPKIKTSNSTYLSKTKCEDGHRWWVSFEFYPNDVNSPCNSIYVIYVIYLCLPIVVSNTYCVVFVFCLSSSSVTYVASVSGLFIVDCPFGILYCLFDGVFNALACSESGRSWGHWLFQ
jgi:hypothetical protein